MDKEWKNKNKTKQEKTRKRESSNTVTVNKRCHHQPLTEGKTVDRVQTGSLAFVIKAGLLTTDNLLC